MVNFHDSTVDHLGTCLGMRQDLLSKDTLGKILFDEFTRWFQDFLGKIRFRLIFVNGQEIRESDTCENLYPNQNQFLGYHHKYNHYHPPQSHHHNHQNPTITTILQSLSINHALSPPHHHQSTITTTILPPPKSCHHQPSQSTILPSPPQHQTPVCHLLANTILPSPPQSCYHTTAILLS